jgi:DNA-binding NtrC family response regulator
MSEAKKEREALLDEETNTTAHASKKILIAKKCLLARKIFEKVVSNLGHEYLVLENVVSLENALDSRNYDLVFTDTSLISGPSGTV